MLDPCRAPPPPDRVRARSAAPPGRGAAPAGLVVLRQLYKDDPTAARRTALRRRFDRIFTRVTGFAELDEAVARTHANKDELLLILDRPDIPLHTNGSENDVRSYVIKRRISGETRSAAGKQARDAFLSLLKTCSKLTISFWDYLGARLNIPDADRVPWLPDLIRQNASA